MKSPYQTLTAFLRAWKKGNKKQMHLNTTKTWQSEHHKNDFAARALESFEIQAENQHDAVCDFGVVLNGDAFTVRLICEKEAYKASVDGVWGVNPISFKPCQKEK